MTGYGLSRWKSKDCCIEVVIQAYNSKYFESRVQVSPFYVSLEGELRKELQKSFTRGFISLLVTRTPLWPVKKTTVRWNKKQALKWKLLYRKMSSDLKIEYQVNLLDLAQQPGVLDVISQPSLIPIQEKNKLKSLVCKAISLCNKERAREGMALKKDFQKNLSQLSLSLKKIKSHAVSQNKEVCKNMENKIKATDVVDEKKTVQEVVSALINRMDTSEEISRMDEHVRVFRSLITTPEVIGKKLSFYLQEMVREINTVGAKSQDFNLTKEVVQAKSLIERMREQVQNVE